MVDKRRKRNRPAATDDMVASSGTTQHVAYLAAALIRRRPDHEHPASGYYGFHIAGGDAAAPTRSLAGCRFLGTEYVNTCNGVLLLASKGFSDPCRCTVWNPAVPDVAREVPVPKPQSSEKETPVVLPDDKENSAIPTVLYDQKTLFLALGLGYSQSSKTYKLLLCRKDRSRISRFSRYRDPGKKECHVSGGVTHYSEYSLVHSLGSGEGMPLRTVLPTESVLSYKEQVDQEIIERKSLYMDGTIYFLYWKKNVMLAFDVDDETVRTIDMPSERQKRNVLLIEMSSRPCLAMITVRDGITLWLLTADFQLEPIHVISCDSDLYYDCRSIVGIWDCSGVLAMCFEYSDSEKGKLLLYDVAAKKIFIANLPDDLAMNKSDYMLCWGYKPTCVLPGSIIGELSQDMEQRRARFANITEVINPLALQDIRKGQKATLNTVCLMEFLVRIMQKLPHDLQELLEMPSMYSDEPDLLFQNVDSCLD